MPPVSVDLIIKARWLVPVVPQDQLLEHCAVVVDRGDIVAITTNNEADTRYSAKEVIELNHHALIPGLVNAHGHSAMSLLRGYADDHPLDLWLNDHIWPIENKWVDASFVRDGSELAIAEMIRSGTTCFADMYFSRKQQQRPLAVPDCVRNWHSRYWISPATGLPMPTNTSTKDWH